MRGLSDHDRRFEGSRGLFEDVAEYLRFEAATGQAVEERIVRRTQETVHGLSNPGLLRPGKVLGQAQLRGLNLSYSGYYYTRAGLGEGIEYNIFV